MLTNLKIRQNVLFFWFFQHQGDKISGKSAGRVNLIIFSFVWYIELPDSDIFTEKMINFVV